MKILKNYTKFCNFFENTQNFSFATWVSNEHKFHIHFGNIWCIFRKYSKITQNTVTFSKILKIWVLQHGCQINANSAYTFQTFIVFPKILKIFSLRYRGWIKAFKMVYSEISLKMQMQIMMKNTVFFSIKLEFIAKPFLSYMRAPIIVKIKSYFTFWCLACITHLW